MPDKGSLYSIAVYGRGGQGAVTAANMLVKAAFHTGNFPHVMAFPLFGPERRGAPVSAYARISTEPIHDRAKIYDPDVAIIMDPSIFKSLDPVGPVKQGGIVLVNTTRDNAAFKKQHGIRPDIHLGTVDIVSISLGLGLMNGSEPVVNTPVLGAFAVMFPSIPLESVVHAIKDTFSNPTMAELNARAATEAHEKVSVA